jgi:hypothetical protein
MYGHDGGYHVCIRSRKQMVLGPFRITSASEPSSETVVAELKKKAEGDSGEKGAEEERREASVRAWTRIDVKRLPSKSHM